MVINKVMLASSGAAMFYNRIQAFVVPGTVGQPISVELGTLLAANAHPPAVPHQVQASDIYEAARKRAIEEHELDKLFNPGFYDYQI